MTDTVSADVRRRLEANGWLKTCEYCGKEFVAERSDALTCSPGHRVVLARKRRQENLNS